VGVDAAIITANFGGFDRAWEQTPQDVEADWICVTDEPALGAPAPWRVEVVASDLQPRMAAKLPKFFPPVSHRFAIWINASYQILSPGFVRGAIECVHDGIALYRHPLRDCIYEEALASHLPKYDGEPIDEQVEHYRAEGHPEHWGLWECGAVVWDRSDPNVERFASAWLAECERWTLQDQLSFPVVCRRLGVEPGEFPHGLTPVITGSEWLAVREHVA
jgi:hypothetical protein